MCHHLGNQTKLLTILKTVQHNLNAYFNEFLQDDQTVHDRQWLHIFLFENATEKILLQNDTFKVKANHRNLILNDTVPNIYFVHERFFKFW